MILPDNTPESPNKAPTTRLHLPHPDEHTLLPPPAYRGPAPSSVSSTCSTRTEHVPDVDIEAQTSPSESRAPLVHPMLPEYSRHRELLVSYKRGFNGTRFLKVFAIVVIVFLALASFSRTVILAARRRSPEPQLEDHVVENAVSLIPFPKASDGLVEECISLSSFLSVDSAAQEKLLISFDLPLTTNVLYFFGRGPLSRGSLTLSSTNDPSIPEGKIRVDIVPKYTFKAALEKPNICLLGRAPGEKSIGILTPQAWAWGHDLTFAITVRLPVPNRGALHIKTFQDDLALFSHYPYRPQTANWFSNAALLTQPAAVLSLPTSHSEYPRSSSLTSVSEIQSLASHTPSSESYPTATPSWSYDGHIYVTV